MWNLDPWTVVREIARWPVTTQVNARRNALLACTAFAERRRERDDVEQYLLLMHPHLEPQPTGSGSANSRRSSSS